MKELVLAHPSLWQNSRGGGVSKRATLWFIPLGINLGSPNLCSPAAAARLLGLHSEAAQKLCGQNISVALSFPSWLFQLPGLQGSFHKDHEQIPWSNPRHCSAGLSASQDLTKGAHDLWELTEAPRGWLYALAASVWCYSNPFVAKLWASPVYLLSNAVVPF